MQHPAVWASLASPYRLILTRDYPDHAAVAREYVKALPDVAALQFKHFWVSNLTGGQIHSVTVHLESAERVLWIEVQDGGAGLVARAVIDRAKKPWQR